MVLVLHVRYIKQVVRFLSLVGVVFGERLMRCPGVRPLHTQPCIGRIQRILDQTQDWLEFCLLVEFEIVICCPI